MILIVLGLFAAILWSRQAFLLKYEKEHYQGNLYQYNLPVDKLCVSTNDVRHSAFETEDEFHAISLLNIQEAKEDLIVMTGDMVSSFDKDYTNFLSLSKIFFLFNFR